MLIYVSQKERWIANHIIENQEVQILPIDHGYKSLPVYSYERSEYPVDDNFENLIDNWENYKDKIILFLGAGASIGATNIEGEPFPGAYALRNDLWLNFMVRPEERSDFDLSAIALLSLDHTAALIEAKGDRMSVMDYVASRFRAKRPMWQHCVLPYLKPKAIFTTNYDCLIEQGWQTSNGQDVAGELTPVFTASDGQSKSCIPLFKPHGSANYPKRKVSDGGIVISQFDYFDMLTARREMLQEFMKTLGDNCVLFIGYSFQDMDIASHLYEIRKTQKGPRWYAIFPRNDSNVRRMYSERYSIAQINRRFHDFIAELDQHTDFIPADWKYAQIANLVEAGKIAP